LSENSVRTTYLQAKKSRGKLGRVGLWLYFR